LPQLVEPGEDGHEPVDGEALEVGATDAGEVSGGDAGDLFRLPHRESPLVQHAEDPRGQDGAQLLKVGIGASKIAEDVPVPTDQVDISCHFSISSSLFRRSRTRSMSCPGVVIPVFDFFWNAWKLLEILPGGLDPRYRPRVS